MKTFVIFLICITAFTTPLFAQMGPGGGAPPPNGQMPTGRVYGKLIDADGHAVDFATLIIMKKVRDSSGTMQEILAGGATTEANGDFSVDNIPVNTPLVLKASAIGYSNLTRDLMLKPGSLLKDLGNLKMESSKTNLKEVNITASKPYMTVDMDKKVYNVSKSITAVGGTSLDVLKNVPSVNVDLDGNITMRGGSPQIFVDGLPTMLTLDQIPADAIESIELITNPSAKYDASGGGTGILNVILKKNKKNGYNGSIRAGADSYGGYYGGGNISLRTKKFNLTADINARNNRDYGTSSTNRLNNSTTPVTYLHQNQHDTGSGAMIFSKFNMEYSLSNRTTLSLGLFAMHHGNTNNSVIGITTDSLYSAGTTAMQSAQNINSDRSFDGRGATLTLKKLFPKEKQSWITSANYFSGNATSNSSYVTNYYTDATRASISESVLQKIQGGGNDHNIILQSDYTDPIGKDLTLEAGVRAAMQSRVNENNNYTYSATAGDYILVPQAASNYSSQYNVYAAYTTLSGTMGKYSYKAGLRAESSDYSGTLTSTGQTFSNQYPLSLFPSLFVGRKLGGNQEIQLTLTRRVNRPNFHQLIPYVDSSNKLNIVRGNPDLVPEFTQSAELSYIKNFTGKGMIMGSAYYKYTDHLITGYIETDTASSGALTYINTYVNAASSYSMGAEATGQFTITKWWDISANANVYKSQIKLQDAQSAAQQPAMWSWFGKLSTDFRLPAGFAIQLSGFYQSKTNLPVSTNSNQPGPPNMQSQSASQGYIKPFYNIDIAVKKTFMENKLIASLSFSDIFRSRWQDQYTYSTYFTQEYDRIRNPQLLRLNLSYNFGKMDISSFDKKNANNNVQMEE